MGLDGALWSRCCAQSLQSCPTLCNPVDRSPPASSVYGIIQARILEWVAISFSRGLNRPSNWTYISYVSCIGSGFFTTRASRCFDFILSATGSTKELLCFVWGREGYVNILFVFLKKKKKIVLTATWRTLWRKARMDIGSPRGCSVIQTRDHE